MLSGLLTRARQITLMKLGVTDIVHKDEINTARLCEVVLKALDTPAEGDRPASILPPPHKVLPGIRATPVALAKDPGTCERRGPMERRCAEVYSPRVQHW